MLGQGQGTWLIFFVSSLPSGNPCFNDYIHSMHSGRGENIREGCVNVSMAGFPFVGICLVLLILPVLLVLLVPHSWGAVPPRPPASWGAVPPRPPAILGATGVEFVDGFLFLVAFGASCVEFVILLHFLCVSRRIRNFVHLCGVCGVEFAIS
jgi:hypothetical protein